jgi:hypothetical protein
MVSEGIREDILMQIQDENGYSDVVPFNMEDYMSNLRDAISKSSDRLFGIKIIHNWDREQLETWLVEDTFEKMGY